MKASLVSALSACAGESERGKARRFLQGLSSDELQYIADFFGACILECSVGSQCSRGELADGIAAFESYRRRARAAGIADDRVKDCEHKMILLLEYLCRCGLNRFSLALRATGQT